MRQQQAMLRIVHYNFFSGFGGAAAEVTKRLQALAWRYGLAAKPDNTRLEGAAFRRQRGSAEQNGARQRRVRDLSSGLDLSVTRRYRARFR